MVKFVVGDSHDKLLFHTVFWIGSAMQIICGIILFFFNEDKYDYGIVKNIDGDSPTETSINNLSNSMTAAVTPDENNSD